MTSPAVIPAHWRLFPVASDGRSPLIAGGCHSATNDPDQIARWRSSGCNLALACGSGSGVLALDIDAKGDVDGFASLAELTAEFGHLPETAESITPSGGAHMLFTYPDGPAPANRVGIKRYGSDGTRRVYRGLDVRGQGGSVCLPPSHKAGGVYAWRRAPADTALAEVPRWLLALFRSEPPPRPPTPPLRLSSLDRTARYICAAVDGECGELSSMAVGSGRNQRLFIASAKLGELVGAGLLSQVNAEAALERAATECGLLAEDGVGAVRATISSGIRRGLQNPREVAA
jgi:putative DNA primase/helicase